MVAWRGETQRTRSHFGAAMRAFAALLLVISTAASLSHVHLDEDGHDAGPATCLLCVAAFDDDDADGAARVVLAGLPRLDAAGIRPGGEDAAGAMPLPRKARSPPSFR